MPTKKETTASQIDSHDQEIEFPTVSAEEKYEQLLSIFLEAEKNWKGGR
tara:strand:- start:5152 stop:5298 length:147 start_codon:yes stop_codon:yes gene_type:complete